MRRQRFLLLSLAVLALDQWSKWLVEAHLPAGAAHPVIPGFFHLVHVRNTGVAFGLLATGSGAGRWWLIAVGLLALAAVATYFAVLRRPERSVMTALALLMGGAAGNLLDRLFETRGQGAVTDFVDLQVAGWHWPAFNVADSAITLGLVLLAVEVARGQPEPAATTSARRREAPP